MTRRTFLFTPALLPAPALLHARERVTREVFVRSPGKGTAVLAHAWYTDAKLPHLRAVEKLFSRSDTVEVARYRDSRDNGRTWSEPEAVATGEKRAGGMWRMHPHGGFADPRNGRYVEFRTEAVLPTDDPLEGQKRWNVHYRVGSGAWRPIVHEGAEYTAQHPLPGVWIGRNMAMMGDVTAVPFAAPGGEILLPAMTSPLAADGVTLYNPAGGYTYTDARVLHARWRGDGLVWRAAEPVKGDPARSTRGMVEPTIERLSRGRLLMVMRGSNDRNHALPAWRWVSFSEDGGWHWTTPRPWTYHDGTPFYSPSSCSQLLRHSSGRLFWIGHISPDNARGNRPRYPVYVAEIDQDSGLVIRDRKIQVDDRQPGEDEILMLHPPYGREDRETKEIVLHMSRMFAFAKGFEGDALIYRVAV
jgi:hypothetical protein